MTGKKYIVLTASHPHYGVSGDPIAVLEVDAACDIGECYGKWGQVAYPSRRNLHPKITFAEWMKLNHGAVEVESEDCEELDKSVRGRR